jgi:hypothetical protein
MSAAPVPVDLLIAPPTPTVKRGVALAFESISASPTRLNWPVLRKWPPSSIESSMPGVGL